MTAPPDCSGFCQHSRPDVFSGPFEYRAEENLYLCPGGQQLHPRRRDAYRKVTEYVTRKGVCDACALRTQCTRAKHGRTIMHQDRQELINIAREQAASLEARRDRSRRRHLAEGSFADAKRHHFKRSRWRRLWRQQIQDHIIAAIQNIKILIKAAPNDPTSPAQLALLHALALVNVLLRRVRRSNQRSTHFRANYLISF